MAGECTALFLTLPTTYSGAEQGLSSLSVGAECADGGSSRVREEGGLWHGGFWYLVCRYRVVLGGVSGGRMWVWC